jgi:hypothetical protein
VDWIEDDEPEREEKRDVHELNGEDGDDEVVR